MHGVSVHKLLLVEHVYQKQEGQFYHLHKIFLLCLRHCLRTDTLSNDTVQHSDSPFICQFVH